MSDDALIVAAGKWASGDYDRYDAYICQPKRKVPATGRLGFYDNGRILQYLPQITGVARRIECSTNGLELLTSRRDLSTSDLDRAKALVRRLLDDKNHRVTKKETVTFVFLTPKSDRDTIVLKRTINNDKLDKNGNRTAFTQNHRYVSIDALLKATTTSDLEGPGRHDDLNGTVLDDGPRAGDNR